MMHCVKKYGCALEQKARPRMRFGKGFIIAFAHLKTVRERWSLLEHGLLKTDVDMADRMSVPRWYRICDPRVRRKLLVLKSRGR